MHSRIKKIHFSLCIALLLNTFLFSNAFSQAKAKSGAAKQVVTGKVVDEVNHPMVGVSVLLKGTALGTMTDANGVYRIEIPGAFPTARLQFSFIGMVTQEAEVLGRYVINMQLVPDAQAMEDVVIEGAYGMQQKRSDLVNSAYQVGSQQLATLPSIRVDQMLDGLVPGLTVEPNDVSAGSTRPRLSVRVRGAASMSASNEPLWVVDGTPFYTGDRTNMVPGMSYSISPLSFMNPEDIASITVLKDASAVSIYGADGANGVILVTTKTGVEGATKVNVSTEYSVAMVNSSTFFQTLSADDYRMLSREAYNNAVSRNYLDPSVTPYPFVDNASNAYSTTNTYWKDVYYDLGNTMQTNLSLRGGSERAKFYVSGGYFRNESTVMGNLMQRFSLRTNVDVKLSNKVKLGIRMANSYNINDLFMPGDHYYELLPIYSPYNADGSFRLYNTYAEGYEEGGAVRMKTSRFLNSVAEREQNDFRQTTLLTKVDANLEWQLAPGLQFTTQFGIDVQNNFEMQYKSRKNWSGMELTTGVPLGYASRSHSNLFNWTWIDRLNYAKNFGQHKLTGLLGFEMTSKQYYTMGASGSGFVNDYIREISYAATRYNSTSGQKLTRSMSFFGQLGYNYDNRYIAQVNARMDGNSNFGTDVRWAQFGSLGLSWNVHKEAFFDVEALKELKLKASYGSNGNSRLGSQESQGTYTYNTGDNYMGQSGGSMASVANQKLSWETTLMTNLGIRIAAFDFLEAEFEWYNNLTKNLLSEMDVSRATGDTRVYRNVGEIQNRGWELSVKTINLKKKAVAWDTEFKFSSNSNKLLELYNGIEKTNGNYLWKEGYDTKTFYLIRWAGVDPRDGMPLWYDARGNLTRNYSLDNRVLWRSATPDLTGSVINTVQYGPFSLRMMLTYVIGGYGFSTFGRNVSSDGLYIMSQNQSINQLDRWQQQGDLALSPIPLWGISTKSIMNSTRFVSSRTHVRLSNISLTYKLPKKVCAHLALNSCNVSVIGNNLGIWTPYDVSDWNSYRQNMSGYPMESVVSCALEVGF